MHTDSLPSGCVAASGQLRQVFFGLQELLRDVVGGKPGFRAILVYDVSRWGRFQDTDEAAHYEFLCKQAGIPVHYCAETFTNDGTLSSLIVKALKRTMAAEYSRELSVKVLAGQKRLASLGFWQGAAPGYGLRRLLVSPDRAPKQLLKDGERKNIATDRVIFVPGPPHEIRVVREIYKMLVCEGRTLTWIARELNRSGVPFLSASKWDYCAVRKILTHPKYAGIHIFGRTSQKLLTPRIQLPNSEWTVAPGAFEPIVDQGMFTQAQKILQNHRVRKSDQELLDGLRSVLAKEGRLSLPLIQNGLNLASLATYRKRFGSIRHAYDLIGYDSRFATRSNSRRRTNLLRNELVSQILALFPDEVTPVLQHRRRARLQLQDLCQVVVTICRRVRPWRETIRWEVVPLSHDRHEVTLLARLTPDNTGFQDYYVVPYLDRPRRFTIKSMTSGSQEANI